MTKPDLETLAEMRLADASALLNLGRDSAAYYLAGYAIELAIKACIAKVFEANRIPDKAFVNAVYSHKLVDLLGLAGLGKDLQDEMKLNPDLATAWSIVSKWTEASRYESWDAFAASALIDAVGSPAHGVLQWLKKRW